MRPNRPSAAAAAALAAAVLITGVVAAPAGTQKKPKCAVSGAVIDAGREGIVFRRGPRDDFIAYACSYATGKTRSLGQHAIVGPGRETDRFQVAGRYVGYITAHCSSGAQDCDDYVTVLDLRTRRTTMQSSFGDLTSEKLVLATNGSVAWVRKTGTLYEVRRIDGRGEAVVDSGSDIEPSSLAIAGSSVYWRKGGGVQSMQLQ